MSEKNNNPSRPGCQPYQRAWRGYCVDAKLRDSWLIDLNQLNGLNLISICAGHPEDPARRINHPHINLRLKPELIRFGLPDFLPTLENMTAAMDKSFSTPETPARLEWRQIYTAGVTTWRYEVLMRILSIKRITNLDHYEIWMPKWFDETVTIIKKFDQGIFGKTKSGL